MTSFDGRLDTLAKTSIDSDNPAGENGIGYGKLDELVRSRLLAPQAEREEVAWPAVLEEATRLLESSRDLRFWRWVAHALQETQGLAGLRQGIHLLGDLCKTFGMALHPDDAAAKRAEVDGFDTFSSTTLESGGLVPDVSLKTELAEVIRCARLNAAEAGMLGEPPILNHICAWLQSHESALAVDGEPAESVESAKASTTAVVGKAAPVDPVAAPARGAYHDLGSLPIAGDNPAGARILDWGALGREYFSKLSSPTAGAIVWSDVCSAALEMLEVSKDLRVALVATEALMRTKGLPGLLDGFDLLACLGRNFGSKLYPKREGDRLAKVIQFEEVALAWFLEKRGGLQPESLAHLAQLEKNLSAAREGLVESCGDATLFARLGRSFNTRLEELKKEAGTGAAALADEITNARAPTAASVSAEELERPVPAAQAASAEQPGKYHSLGTTPISAESPAGQKITDWGRLGVEYFQKLSSPVGGAINWNSVASAALEMLEESKDLRVALVANRALMQTSNLRGLAEGMDLLGNLAATFGEQLHPCDPSMRHKKILGFEEEARAWFEQKKTLLNAEGLSQLKNLALKAEFASEQLGKLCAGNVVLTRLCRTFNLCIAELESASVPATPAPLVGGQTTGAGSTTRQNPVKAPGTSTLNSLPGSVDSPAEASRLLGEAQKILRLVTGHCRHEHEGQPIVRRLERMTLWLLNLETPADKFLEQPSAETLERLAKEVEKGQASVEELEKLVSTHFFWLAGQRLLHDQLQADERQPEADAVRAETSALLAALPGLAELSFKDGAAVADEDTQAWLSPGHVLPSSSLPDLRGLVDEEQGKQREKIREEANKLAAEGRVPEAIARYQRASQHALSGRERFLWKLELAFFCFANSPAIARSLLGDLEAEVAREGIGSWEPELAITVYTELIKLCTEDEAARRDELFGKLVLIDPQKAALLDSKAPQSARKGKAQRDA